MKKLIWMLKKSRRVHGISNLWWKKREKNLLERLNSISHPLAQIYKLSNTLASIYKIIANISWRLVYLIRCAKAASAQAEACQHYANTMPTHAYTMYITRGLPLVLPIFFACVGIVLACLSLGTCGLGTAYLIYNTAIIQSAQKACVVKGGGC